MEHITSSVHLFMKETAAEWAATMIETRGIPNMSRKYEYHHCLWRMLALALLKSLTCRRLDEWQVLHGQHVYVLVISSWSFDIFVPIFLEIMTGACKYDQTFGIFVTKSSRCCIKGNPSYRRQDEWLLLEIRMWETFWGGKDLSKSPIFGCKTVFSSTN